MEPLYWQVFFWLVQVVVFIPATAFASVAAWRFFDQKSSKMEEKLVGEWLSSFMMNQNEDWIDQHVVVSKVRFRRGLKIVATGDRAEFDWHGMLEPKNNIFVGHWENTANPTTGGSQSLSIDYFYNDGFVAGATTGSNKALSKLSHISSWVMAKSPDHLESAKLRVVAETAER